MKAIVGTRVISFILALGFLPHCAALAAAPACATLIEVAKANPSEAFFLASYPTAEPGPLHNVAFLYDNAVATIALVGCGAVHQATAIGEAMLLALEHDRFWKDGRLRNGYAAGAVSGRPVKTPGWWDSASSRWVEDGYQVGSDTGNMAWAILALLTLHERTDDVRFRDGAVAIAKWLELSRSPVEPAGFSGGTFGFEPSPKRNTWKSTEHNTDLAAAFRRLSKATDDSHWSKLGDEARAFVEAMWQRDCRCFAVGTGEDGSSPNMLLALDAQIWPLFAIGGVGGSFPDVLETVSQRLAVDDGYAYSEAKQGVWTEGTAQVGLLLLLQGKAEAAAALQAPIARNRTTDGWYFAGDTQELPTGFMLDTDPSKPRVYFRMAHLGALAWVALFERGFNPFTGSASLPSPEKTKPDQLGRAE